MSIATIGRGSANLPDIAAGAGFGVGSGTPVLTMDGVLPVEFLCPGDRIVTRTGSCRLAEVAVSVRHRARVVRIARDVRGQGDGRSDLMLDPRQPILIRDWRAKAMFGVEQALVPAERLVDGEYVRSDVVGELRLFKLIFDTAAVFYMGKIEALGAGALTMA